MPWFSSCCSNCSRNRYSGTLLYGLLIVFDLEYLLWLRPLHTAEKHHPTMFHTATVRPTRSGPNILYNTSLNEISAFFEYYNCQLKTEKNHKNNWFYLHLKIKDFDIAQGIETSGQHLTQLCGSNLHWCLHVPYAQKVALSSKIEYFDPCRVFFLCQRGSQK